MKIAIDVVLLPPEEIMDFCIEINKGAAEKGQDKGPLGKEDFIPHISLAMGCMEEEKLPEVMGIIKNIANNFPPLKLEITELYYATACDGIKSYGLLLKKTEILQKLHEKLMGALDSFLTYDATSEAIYFKEDESPAEPEYVNEYKDKFSYENFKPHITLRCKEADYKTFPIEFTVSALAVCHVGISTTCRKILFQTKLNK